MLLQEKVKAAADLTGRWGRQWCPPHGRCVSQLDVFRTRGPHARQLTVPSTLPAWYPSAPHKLLSSK